MLYALSAMLLSVHTLRRPDWVGVFTLLTSIGLIGAILFSSLGQPKPSWMFRQNADYQLLAVDFEEPTAIYLWLDRDYGSRDPISIKMPWSEQEAIALQKLMLQAQTSGNSAIVHFSSGRMVSFSTHIRREPLKHTYHAGS